jgi:hypothetical protein
MERKIPPALWVSMGALGAISLVQLRAGVRSGSAVLLVAVALNVALLAGLWLGHKWAYVGTLILALSGLVVALGMSTVQALSVLLGNGLVVVPMVVATRFFFPGRPENPGA